VAWLTGTFWWLVVSMHTFGGLPKWAAIIAMLALAVFLGGYTTLTAVLWRRWQDVSKHPWKSVWLWSALWMLAELMRGQWLTGFPWGGIAYAHGDNLAGWAPWIGVFGVTFVVAAVAASMGVGMDLVVQGAKRGFVWLLAGVAAYALAIGVSPGLQSMALASGMSTGSLNVRLLQGNIGQGEKFEPGTGVQTALQWYPQQIHEALATQNRDAPALVVAPETALPMLAQQLDESIWQSVLQGVAERGAVDAGGGKVADGAVLIGIPLGSFEAGYTNSAWGLSSTTAEAALLMAAESSATEAVQRAPLYRYDKHHLVPFGEFIPPWFRWFTDLMNIPLGDFRRGALVQPVWDWGGQRISAHICYEDLFGEELAAQFTQPRPPTMLVNLSNIAWFGDTVAIDQHLQIARWRAMELGRPVIRATNTGATALIDHTGKVQGALPRLTRGTLDGVVQGRDGLTPYAQWASRWGMLPLWAMGLMVVLYARPRGHHRGARAARP
jgi:apolipoprotein N-acyltransferase